MSINWVTFVGFFAATCTTIAFLPQVIKTIKTKQTKDISFWMYLTLIIGQFSWLMYGIFIKDIAIIVANAVACLLAGSVFVFKIKYK